MIPRWSKANLRAVYPLYEDTIVYGTLIDDSIPNFYPVFYQPPVQSLDSFELEELPYVTERDSMTTGLLPSSKTSHSINTDREAVFEIWERSFHTSQALKHTSTPFIHVPMSSENIPFLRAGSLAFQDNMSGNSMGYGSNSVESSYTADSAYESIPSPGETVSLSASNGGYLSIFKPMAAELVDINDDFGPKDKDEDMLKDEYVFEDAYMFEDGFVHIDEMTPLAHGTSSKRERTSLGVSVEDFSRKKRRMSTHGSPPQVSQLPDVLQPAQTPYGSISIKCHLQTLDAHTQKQSEASDFERDMDQSSDVGDSDNYGDNGSSNDDDDNNNDDDDDDENGDNNDDNDYDDYDEYDSDSVDEMEAHYKLKSPHTTEFAQDTTHSRGSRNRNIGSNSATPSRANVSFASSTSDLQHRAAIESPRDGEDNDVAIGSGKRLSRSEFKPQDLMCWHAANGFRCPGNKTGMSPEVRRLLNDHSCSTKSINHHRLPPRCQRCLRLFEDDISFEQHTEKLKSNTPCDILAPEDLERANKEVNRKGISPDCEKQIKNALRRFKKDRQPPPGCTPMLFETWITRNRPIYIGQSNITEEGAESELGQWLTVWYLLFPGEELPDHPFGDAGGWKQSQRIADLSISGIRDDSTKGLLPKLTQEHLEIIRRHISKATKIQSRETLKERNATPKARKQRQRRAPLTPNSYLSSSSRMATPALSQPEFASPNHSPPETYNEETPGGAIGLQTPPTQHSRIPVAAVTPTPLLYPSLDQLQDPETNFQSSHSIPPPQLLTSAENETGPYDRQAYNSLTVPGQDSLSAFFDNPYPFQEDIPDGQNNFNELLVSALSQQHNDPLD